VIQARYVPRSSQFWSGAVKHAARARLDDDKPVIGPNRPKAAFDIFESTFGTTVALETAAASNIGNIDHADYIRPAVAASGVHW